MAEDQTIVIDNGSCSFKIGFGGEECPKVTFPNMVGVQKYNTAKSDAKNIYVGDEAVKKAGILNVFYPVEHGSVTNWDYMDKILNLGFSELNVKSEDYRVLVSEPSNITKANREKMIQNMFETFKVPSYYSADQGVLNIISSGSHTGISLDIGHELTQVVPVINDHALEYAILCEYLAGQNITQYLRKLLNSSNKTNLSTNPSDFLKAQDIKEKTCFFSTEPNSEPISYMFSDGSTIELSEECTTCTDLLFNPSLNDLDQLTRIDQLVYDSIMKTDLINERDTFFENIVVSGGTASMKGFQEKFEKEMTVHAPPSRKIRISYPTDVKFGSWIGGSILSGLSYFNEMVVTKDEYEECGATIVHHKCF